MVKARQARFDASIIDNRFSGIYRGAEDDIAYCVEKGIETLIRRQPQMRRTLIRAMRNAAVKTRPRRVWEWIHSLKVGVFVIPGVLGVMWLIGQIGHALGVM